MFKKITGLVGITLLMLMGCQQEVAEKENKMPWVKTFVIQEQVGTERILSGQIRARHEIPIAFRLSGLIEQRFVDAGQQVKKGQLLFKLDSRDLSKELDARKAEASAAKSAIAVAEADVARGVDLLKKKFISQQALDRFKLVKREAQERLNAALARVQQAKNALGYAELVAEADGLLTEVIGERGQVVAVGEVIGGLAKKGEMEVELFFPEAMAPPSEGVVALRNGSTSPIALREVAGAADPVSHTWRARYRLLSASPDLALGNIVRVSFKQEVVGHDNLEVPLAALDERGGSPHVWIIKNGQAEPVGVELVHLRPETALVRVALPAGSHIIALGTHLLQSGMAVRPLPR
ncbi:MAG: efflux RND transporter periplasmic adaptor subunit [Deltaproteobacteria bacterium]|nr:efflux RND transporter periplasmic adaptor subunit [Deltaproteobacteria bacterium]